VLKHTNHSIFFFLLLIALSVQFYCVRHSDQPQDDRIYTSLVRVRIELGPSNVPGQFELYDPPIYGSDKLLMKKEVAGVCVDKQRGLVVLSNAYFDLYQYSGITVIVHDGCEVPAKVVFQDREFCLAVLKIDDVPDSLSEVAIEPVMCERVNGYHLMYGGAYHCCAEVLPTRQHYPFAAWAGCPGGHGSIFIHPDRHTLVGISILSYQDKQFVLECGHIAHMIRMVQSQSIATLYKTVYDMQIVSADALMTWGQYSRSIDQQLSVVGDEEMARYVCVVTRGDGVLQPGDIMKYYHVGIQKESGRERVIWGALNRQDQSVESRVKVLRRGRVLEVQPEIVPYDISNVIHTSSQMTFWQPGLFFRHCLGWKVRSGCFARDIGDQYTANLGVPTIPPRWCCWQCALDDEQEKRLGRIITRVNGQEFSTMDEFAKMIMGPHGVIMECGEPRRTQRLWALRSSISEKKG